MRCASRLWLGNVTRWSRDTVRHARPGSERDAGRILGRPWQRSHTLNHHVRPAPPSAFRYPRPSRRDSRASRSPFPGAVMLDMEEHHHSLSSRIPRDIPLCRSPFHMEAPRRATEPRRQRSKTCHHGTRLLLPYPVIHACELLPMAGPDHLGTPFDRWKITPGTTA
jgi:hypothetical protein